MSPLGLGLLIFFFAVAVVADPAAKEDDVKCLQGVKSCLVDSDGKLSSWRFSNATAEVGFICNFVGVTCWNDQENRIIDLRLPSMNLTGAGDGNGSSGVPAALRYCPSINNLDLSGNRLAGGIPPELCRWLPYLVHLDLSSNQLSGEIPPELADCKYLNSLHLDDNRLTGGIPPDLARLPRLKRFSAANNRLAGAAPAFLTAFDRAGFSGNDRLCGAAVRSPCSKLGRRSFVVIVTAGVLGAAVSLLLGFAVWRWLLSPRLKKTAGAVAAASWTDVLLRNKLAMVVLFHKPISKLRLADLISSTNNFSPHNAITSGRTGTSFLAVLSDGSALSVKRLSSCRLQEKQFKAEMVGLGHLRHPNLVPLLGYCAVQDEKLLVYKHMPHGTLSSLLHTPSPALDWPTRRRVAAGAARGLAWLHHGFMPPVLHQNISSNAILVDEDYIARITDFGLAKLMAPLEKDASTFIHGDFGDFGYVAPEYASTLVASIKGDVYGFGVVLLELVTGQKPFEVSCGGELFKGNLVDWVNHCSMYGSIRDVVDMCLWGKGHDDQILQVLKVACACVASRPKDRPSLYNVYQSLRSICGAGDFSENDEEFPLMFGRNDAEK